MMDKDHEIPKPIRDYIMEKNKTTPYHRLLDMNITELARGYCEAKLKVENKHINPYDITPGGVGFSILDVVIGTAATTKGISTTTIEMNVNFLKPSKEGDLLVAKGLLIKEGKNIVVGEGKLYRGDELLAVSRQSMMNLGALDL